jgi:hypothetical protein
VFPPDRKTTNEKGEVFDWSKGPVYDQLKDHKPMPPEEGAMSTMLAESTEATGPNVLVVEELDACSTWPDAPLAERGDDLNETPYVAVGAQRSYRPRPRWRIRSFSR